MRKKFKILIGVTSGLSIVITIVLILLSLDRLDVEYYGLNYNYITANFSDNLLYSSGVHYIGISNTLLQVNRIPQIIKFSNLKTYTSDFYPLTLSVTLTYVLNLPATAQFEYISNFYVNFGNNPSEILKTLFTNEIITISSIHDSFFYQNTITNTTNNSITALQLQIKNSITEKILIWTNMTIVVLVESVVCEGLSRNTQAVDRIIENLQAKSKRTDQQVIQLTSLFLTTKSKFQLEVNQIKQSINRRITQISNNKNTSAYKSVFGTQIMYNNLPYASSQLKLNPKLYFINNQTVF